ncbi:MAG: 2-hydroxyacyl-CoA dehydratase [Kofleriaceae bacterium]|nr:2-hydroxyacyl-CoA dehydratase [Kofleriaceae bacterium]
MPYVGDGVVTDAMRSYVVEQLQREVIPKLEKVTGRRLDLDRLRERLACSRRAEDDLAWVFRSARHRPSPIDAYFGGSVYYIGPIFTSFRGSGDACRYRHAARRGRGRLAAGQGPITPTARSATSASAW